MVTLVSTMEFRQKSYPFLQKTTKNFLIALFSTTKTVQIGSVDFHCKMKADRKIERQIDKLLNPTLHRRYLDHEQLKREEQLEVPRGIFDVNVLENLNL